MLISVVTNADERTQRAGFVQPWLDLPPAADLASATPADLVLTAGRIWTGEPGHGWATGMATRGGRIVGLAPRHDVQRLIGPSTRVVELHGRMVVPGFGDAHVHPVTGGLASLRCDLRDLRGLDAYLGVIARYAADNPDRAWIEGEGWSMADFPGGTPRREDLDRVVPDRPALLHNRDGHGAWVNSRALELAGVDRDTPDPSDGRIERDPDGTPSGTLHEGAMHLVERLIPEPTAQEWEEGLRIGQRYLHSLGITSWQDAIVRAPIEAAYRALGDGGELTARVVGALWWEHERGLEQVDELLERRARGPAGRFVPTSVKIMQDGVAENFTAGMTEPYLGPHGQPTANSGKSFVEPALLAEAVMALDKVGFQVHFHAIGDRAVREALDAIEAARRQNGPTDGRHHISHIQVIHPDDIPRFRELDTVANAQPFWAVHEGQMDDLTIPFLGPRRATWQYPFRSLRRAGAVLAMGSDWAVSTPDPLLEIEVAVNRVPPDRRGEVEPFLPEERLDLPDALAAFTAGTAYVNHLDGEAGVLAPGRLADFAIVDRDLFELGDTISDARVLATFVEGIAVFEDPAFDG
jgi:predicted amidohydrolase YtcJ